MVRPLGDSIYLRYLQEVMWNLHLSAQAKRPLVRSCEGNTYDNATLSTIRMLWRGKADRI